MSNILFDNIKKAQEILDKTTTLADAKIANKALIKAESIYLKSIIDENNIKLRVMFKCNIKDPNILFDLTEKLQTEFNQESLIALHSSEKRRILALYAKIRQLTMILKWTTNEKKKAIISELIKSLEIHIVNFKTIIYNKILTFYTTKLQKAKKLTKPQKDKNAIIELQNVYKYYFNGIYSIKVLKNINLQIQRGKIIVILGASGGGKTTLLNLISGMDTITYGNIIVNGQNISNANGSKLTDFRRDNIGYVFQQYGLLSNLTVKENVEIGLNLAADKARAMDLNELLNTLGIYQIKDKYPHELSGGQQQRVSIARSIAKNPQILFGDEPTGAVDDSMTKQIMKLFVEINEKYGTTIIIVTHNQVISKLADEIILMKEGQIDRIIKNKKQGVDEIEWSTIDYFKK